jgi:hypothetical protein
MKKQNERRRKEEGEMKKHPSSLQDTTSNRKKFSLRRWKNLTP